MIHSLKATFVAGLLLCLPKVFVCAEYNPVVAHIVTRGKMSSSGRGANTFFSAYRNGFKDGLSVTPKAPSQPQPPQQRGGYSIWTKVAVTSVIVATGGVLWWLRRQYATPKDLKSLAGRVQEHQAEQQAELQKTIRSGLQTVGTDADCVVDKAEELQGDVTALLQFIQESSEQNTQARQALVQRMFELQQAGMQEVFVVINGQLTALDVAGVTRVVTDCSQQFAARATAMTQQLSAHAELQDKEHAELMNDLESLATHIPAIQQLVTKNGKDIDTLLVSIQQLRVLDEEHDRQVKLFKEKYGDVISRVVEQRKKFQEGIAGAQSLEHELDTLIALLTSGGVGPSQTE